LAFLNKYSTLMRKNCSSLEDPGTDVSVHRIPPEWGGVEPDEFPWPVGRTSGTVTVTDVLVPMGRTSGTVTVTGVSPFINWRLMGLSFFFVFLFCLFFFWFFLFFVMN
jgi:hypothetical protein